MLEDIKLLLGITSTEKDKLLQLLIRQATDEAKTFTHNDNVCDLEYAIQQMVIFKYNRTGCEGIAAESYSGASYTYMTDYPENILNALRKNRKIITL